MEVYMRLQKVCEDKGKLTVSEDISKTFIKVLH